MKEAAGKKDKLEALLARVRERGSGLHRALVEPPGSRASPGLELEGVGPGPIIDDEELEQVASRRALERHIESALGDDEPSVRFAEEGEGWEPEPLALERGDDESASWERLPSVAPLVERDGSLGEDFGGAQPAWAEREVEPGAAPGLGSGASSDLPPLPLSPFPSEPPPRASRPPEIWLGDPPDATPALTLDVPWETLAKQLRGRRRSGEFRLPDARPASSKNVTPPGGIAAPRHLEASDADTHAPPSAEPTASSVSPRTETAPRTEPAPLTEPSPRTEPAPLTEPGPRTETAPPTEPDPRSEPTPRPPRSKRAPDEAPRSARDASATEPLDAATPPTPASSRPPRRSRRARLRQRRHGAGWLPLVGVALGVVVLAWWFSRPNASTQAASSGRDASTTLDGSRVPSTTDPLAAVTAVPAEPRPRDARARHGVAAEATAAPLAATRPAEASTTAPSPAPPADRPPAESLSEQEGWLLVRGPRLDVYVHGARAGTTGQWLRSPCGVRHLRLAHSDPPPVGSSYPWWVDDGGPIVVPCRAAITIDAHPGTTR